MFLQSICLRSMDFGFEVFDHFVGLVLKGLKAENCLLQSEEKSLPLKQKSNFRFCNFNMLMPNAPRILKPVY